MLPQLDDDTLICVFAFLPVSSILALRQTCKRLAAVSKLRIVWQKACLDQVLACGYPFPYRSLATADANELEKLVLRALRLGLFWLCASLAHDWTPRHTVFQASTGTGVSNVRFIPGHDSRFILTVYKGIWSMISCWEVTGSGSRKITDWCPRNAIFAGFVVNNDPDSEGTLAVAVKHGGGTHSIEILSLFDRDAIRSSFRPVCNIATSFRPIALSGDLIAFSDDASETVVMDWRQNTFALLKGSQRPIDERFQYNRCLQVIFAYESILIVRARSVELFPKPELRPTNGDYPTYSPIGFHTFGWIDGVSLNTQSDPQVDIDGRIRPSGHEPISLLLRAESDDPWASDIHTLEQFVLYPNPAFRTNAMSTSPASESPAGSEKVPTAAVPPYLFPPARAEQTSPTVRGYLRCRDIVLGPSGTALWIQPRAARVAHLTGYDVHSSVAQVSPELNPDVSYDYHQHPTLVDVGSAVAGSSESLCAAVFDGPLQRRHLRDGGAGVVGMQLQPRTLWVQTREGANWTAFDYVEETGRVALGSSDGSVTVLDLI